MESKKINLFKIPKSTPTEIPVSVIGLFDASGSMECAWKYAARCWNHMVEYIPNERKHMITFSSKAGVRELPLSENIQEYGGAQTNICGGIEILNKQIKLRVDTKHVTVVFVSDGDDDGARTLTKRLNKIAIKHDKIITFISVGVGSRFPTFVAIQLRDMFHNGEASVPPLFLIDQMLDQETWETQFGKLKNYLGQTGRVSVSPLVKYLPWLDETAEVNEGSFVYGFDDVLTVDKEIKVEKLDCLSMEQFMECAKRWLSEIQLVSIRGCEAKNAANATLDILNELRVRFFGETCFEEKTNTEGTLSTVEAAKRLAIGTQIGKHHSAAMHLRGITIDDYIATRAYFIDVFQKTTLIEESDQEKSVFSLQNQKDVFREEDLIAGLRLCPSQYDLVEQFPLVGHAIEIQRNDGAMINPYLVRVIGVAKHHKIIDSVHLQTAGNKLDLNIGIGETESVNAILPLFSIMDADLRPLITSKLYSILMTFNVMGNADTCFENAYIALLANTCTYMLCQPKSEWRDNILNLIGSTIEVTYSQSNWFSKYADCLLETPRLAMVTENPAITTKCEDLSKPICFLFYLVWSKRLEDADKIKAILEAIYAEMFGRGIPGNVSVKDCFNAKIPFGGKRELIFAKEVNALIEKLNDVSAYFTIFELKNEIKKHVDALHLELGFKAKVKPSFESACPFVNQGKISLDVLKSIFSFFLPEKKHFTSNEFICFAAHAIKFKNSYERNTNEISYDYKAIEEVVCVEIEKELLQNNQIAKNVYNDLSNKYYDFMFENHFGILPISKEYLSAYCKELGIEESSYIFNKSSNLLTNACMSRKCPFYMKVTNSLSQHLYGDYSKLPAYHKTIKAFSTRPAEKILAKIISGECLNRTTPDIPTLPKQTQKYLSTKRSYYLKDIELLKEEYEIMKKTEADHITMS